MPSYELTRCIVCGDADGVEIADGEAMRGEMEDLWAFHERRLRPGTPARRLMDRVAFSQHPPLRVVRCRRCGLVYRNPTERRHELEAIYQESLLDRDALRSLHDVQRPAYRAQAGRLLDVMGRQRGGGGRRGLEVGSYVGGFLAAAREAGLPFEGLDINPGVNGFVRSLGFAVHDGDLDAFAATTDRAYDAVAIWNTFDQLPDPRAAAHTAWRLLRPGGVLAVRVPNGGAYARLRRLRGRRGGGAAARALLAHNNLLTFPYRFGFTIHSLGMLLERVGFRVRHVHGDVLVPTADEWTRGWARLEERAVKAALSLVARGRAAWAPWIEMYAVRGP